MMSSYELNRAEGLRQAKEVLSHKSAVPMQTVVQAIHFLHCIIVGGTCLQKDILSRKY